MKPLGIFNNNKILSRVHIGSWNLTGYRVLNGRHYSVKFQKKMLEKHTYNGEIETQYFGLTQIQHLCTV